MLNSVKEKGYGIVVFVLDEFKFEIFEIVKRGNSFGVRFKVFVLFLYIIRVEVEIEVLLIVGIEK